MALVLTACCCIYVNKMEWNNKARHRLTRSHCQRKLELDSLCGLSRGQAGPAASLASRTMIEMTENIKTNQNPTSSQNTNNVRAH